MAVNPSSSDSQDAAARPAEGDVIYLYCKATLESGEVIYDNTSSRTPLSFIVGRGEMLPSVEKELRHLKKGEKTSIVLAASETYGSLGFAGLPPNASVQYDLELITFQKGGTPGGPPPIPLASPESASAGEGGGGGSPGRDRHITSLQLSPEDQLECASDSKERGNDFFKKNQIAEALMEYQDALGWFHLAQWSPALQPMADSLQTTLLLNAASCHLRRGEWLEVIDKTGKALEIDPSSTKALFRRGVAKMRLDELENAKKDLLKAAQQDPRNAEIRKNLNECKQRMEAANQREKQLFKGLF
uniref:peptidylprolyl isomerase n=1 Tax=Chromera velia CCMP2878 TaxID=1169474 RepID=A0A0G4G4G3_9ALVE|mmetsp:Transcript_49594/g.97700  ORF Transcript_49594/g.97700 Transcript_49594/m.97700 type:complete len:302 (+) Transcript_49594:217-1122(+)|eukprot:Cvel_555.t1-p1 / transcript=Cvel_555.t1 / gene=Cvel_555 / organism=Chromera_velia_CCMP2878 / gene_product=Peptidyl-prolyl cis-trans isomerase FKBP4, putative / transcript_product=Peptidyl-prolyl cis-trans isomerase FKBP4, putative / location=Cvel_scaffold17:97433-101649(-) / protein_length=301 / sequence_SO=supercontig / SO=protein_coding / is_pseudo=false